MARTPLLWILAVVVALGVTACTQSKATADSTTPLPAPTQQAGTVGAPVSVLGVNLTVMSIDAFTQSPDGFPRLVLAVRSENTTEKMQSNPDASLHCAEATEAGDWFNGSTWEPSGFLPPDNVNEGQLYLGFPAKNGTTKYPVATCTDPRILMTVTKDSDRSQHIVSYDVDSQVIQDAIAAQLGPNLPLPNKSLSDAGTKAP